MSKHDATDIHTTAEILLYCMSSYCTKAITGCILLMANAKLAFKINYTDALVFPPDFNSEWLDLFHSVPEAPLEKLGLKWPANFPRSTLL